MSKQHAHLEWMISGILLLALPTALRGANLRRGTGAAWLVLAVVFWSGGAVAEPEVPGAAVTVYATVTDPITLAFDAAGYLYVGRDNSGSGGGNADAVKIHRVAPGDRR